MSSRLQAAKARFHPYRDKGGQSARSETSTVGFHGGSQGAAAEGSASANRRGGPTPTYESSRVVIYGGNEDNPFEGTPLPSAIPLDGSWEEATRAFRPGGLIYEDPTDVAEAQDRPSSRASNSSNGSVDSGVSHPPRSSVKRKKMVSTWTSEEMKKWLQMKKKAEEDDERGEAAAAAAAAAAAEAEGKPEVHMHVRTRMNLKDCFYRCKYCNELFNPVDGEYLLPAHYLDQHLGARHWTCQRLPALLKVSLAQHPLLADKHEDYFPSWDMHCHLCGGVHRGWEGRDEWHFDNKRCVESYQPTEHNVGRCLMSTVTQRDGFRYHLMRDHDADGESGDIFNVAYTRAEGQQDELTPFDIICREAHRSRSWDRRLKAGLEDDG